MTTAVAGDMQHRVMHLRTQRACRDRLSREASLVSGSPSSGGHDSTLVPDPAGRRRGEASSPLPAATGAPGECLGIERRKARRRTSSFRPRSAVARRAPSVRLEVRRLKARRFVPLPVREKLIPKKSGTLRGLGIPTARDRTVQAALKLVLEPIFEEDFKPCSYGFRPKRRAQDAIEEIFFYTTHFYEWVVEGDIKSCFDEIDHTALMDRVRRRIGDRRVLCLVKAFLKAGILGEDQVLRDTATGTPQGGII